MITAAVRLDVSGSFEKSFFPFREIIKGFLLINPGVFGRKKIQSEGGRDAVSLLQTDGIDIAPVTFLIELSGFCIHGIS